MTDFALASTAGLMLLAAGGLIVLMVVLLAAMRGKAVTISIVLGIITALLFFGGLVAGFSATSGSVIPPPPVATAYVVVQQGAAPVLQTGVTLQTNSAGVMTVSVPLVYNKTGNYFAIDNVVGFTSAKPNFFLFPLRLIRGDAINSSYSFPVSIASIFTQQALGSNAQTYSTVGYTPATSGSSAQWQTYFSGGILANQKPTVIAPGANSQVLADPTVVNYYGSTTSVLHISLAGGNSTSAPTLFAEALTNNTGIMPVTLTVGNAVSQLPSNGQAPSIGVVTVTINFYLLGWGS